MAKREQRVEIEGQNNVVVQIEGDNNTVNLKGLAHLTLTRYLTRRRVDTDIDILSPYSRSIPLIGREAELADLRAWLTGEKPISIRVLTGRAGSGKTRLALELCEQMVAEGWDAGFLESGELERFYAQQNLSTWGWQRPTLIVIDYSAVHAERMSGWFQELADHQGHPDNPMRFLLLERNADSGSGWWQTAFGRGGFGARAIQGLLDPAEPVALAPIRSSDDRRDVIGATLEKAEGDQRPPEEGADPAFDRQLAELTWGGEPLFLMMAGLMAKNIGMANVLSLGRTDLALALAERELARIAEIGKANGVSPDFMEVMAAYVTLCRGLDVTQIRAVVSAEEEALGLPSTGDPGVVAKVLCDALPGENGAAPILPDMIGEAAILVALPRHYDGSGTEAVVRAFEQVGLQAAASTIRTAQDFAATGHLEPLEWFDALVEHGSIDVQQLMLIANELPQTSLALAEHAARIHQSIERTLRGLVRKGEEHQLPNWAGALNNLAIGLSVVGQREAALASAQEAAELYRELAANAPDVYRPALASALSSLADRLGAVGQRGEALARAQEAVAIRRELAAKAPDAYRPDLASALNNLAIRLSQVGQRQEALAPAQEAAELYRSLAANAPDTYRPDLARALNTLANRLSEVGQRQEALAPAHQAVAIRRELAAKAPDAYQPALASALHTLAIRLSELGHRGEALAPAQEAVVIRRQLAAKTPDAFRPDLASSVHNLATCLSQVDQLQEALPPAEEAADLYRELAAEAPDAYRPALASALSNLADRLGAVGQRQEALAPAQEAVAIRRELAAAAPDTFRPDLASALRNLATRLTVLAKHKEALAPAQEAADVYRELAAAAPDIFRPDLATALHVLAAVKGELGQHQEALGPGEDAVAIQRELAKTAPSAASANLASALNNLARLLRKDGSHEEALAPAREAENLYRALAKDAPDAFRAGLAYTLNNLAISLNALGRPREALVSAQEAVGIRRELAKGAPDAFRPDLAFALRNLADGLGAIGQHQRARQAAEEAIRMLAPQFLALPAAFASAMRAMARDYQKRCQKIENEPDDALLAPILKVLKRMKEGSGGEA